MSLVFNMVGGGSGSAELPAIYATYPAGSVCTCTNGTKTFTAKDTSGFWLFAGLELGMWTVTSTDPTGENNPARKTVAITAAGQIMSVELYYVLWLYKDGNEYIDITGGWQARAWNINSQHTAKIPSITRNADDLEIAISGALSCGAVEIKKDVDLSTFNTLVFDYSLSATGGIVEVLVIDRNKTFFFNEAVAEVKLLEDSGTTTQPRKTVSLDVSSISGAYDIAIALYGNWAAVQTSINVNMYSMKLEQ